MMKTCVVSNTGPVIALMEIGKLEILRGLFTRIEIPRAVCEELAAGYSNAASGGKSLELPDWIEVVTPSTEPDPLLARMLDPGEAAVIHLACGNSNKMILMDEKKGRKIAGDIYHLSVIGTAGLLIKAKSAGLIPSASALIMSMRDNGYWIDDVILNFVRRETNE